MYVLTSGASTAHVGLACAVAARSRDPQSGESAAPLPVVLASFVPSAAVWNLCLFGFFLYILSVWMQHNAE